VQKRPLEHKEKGLPAQLTLASPVQRAPSISAVPNKLRTGPSGPRRLSYPENQKWNIVQSPQILKWVAMMMFVMVPFSGAASSAHRIVRIWALHLLFVVHEQGAQSLHNVRLMIVSLLSRYGVPQRQKRFPRGNHVSLILSSLAQTNSWWRCLGDRQDHGGVSLAWDKKYQE